MNHLQILFFVFVPKVVPEFSNAIFLISFNLINPESTLYLDKKVYNTNIINNS
ncbi:Uncharacterised protein [Elizabethkingia anophelis]|uniref:Uncharacterized protein n=1 Tax=Elizabethkingia anophelis TaxID=1117645 RepID=A0A7Z7LVL8_9FLAO|nr:Uncharacterised protein [Elizabethkingia anophelis]